MTHDQENSVIFENFKNVDLQFFGNYQTTIATFVQGDVNFSYFGLNEDIGGVLSCDPNKTIISSIGKLSSVEGSTKSSIWKIFSRKSLDASMLNKIFTKVWPVTCSIKSIKYNIYIYLFIKYLFFFRFITLRK